MTASVQFVDTLTVSDREVSAAGGGTAMALWNVPAAPGICPNNVSDPMGAPSRYTFTVKRLNAFGFVQLGIW